MNMNPDIKKKWIDALTSGKYEQATGVLRRPDSNSYCCLGVLCEVYREETGGGEWVEVVDEHPEGGGVVRLYFDTDGGDGSFGSSSWEVAPKTVANWAGMPDENPNVNGVDSLAQLNDRGISFKEIAEVIDANL